MSEKNRILTEDFTKLFLELKSEGLFEPSYLHILLRIIDVLITGLVGYFLFCCHNSIIKAIGLVIIGVTQGRCGWIQHEGGHLSLTGNPKLDRFIQNIFIGKH